ncbi:hypothetical protein HMPREF0083_04288 [Aneurinibacillus aneurinilyticus ATCC 12856]|uniref:Uncharacterized protein n=1 Tax=Aneurinibacillus aneurinilyticus ATCC 12856 TaxID=649747 RepID=U1WGB3_ANEAE|nr:hypothetical protein HMPREF0083_04288 [Aneurinibacillus aneurinilyticus ATCC 12856]
MVGRRKFGKKKRVDAPCASAEERLVCLFSVYHTGFSRFKDDLC